MINKSITQLVDKLNNYLGSILDPLLPTFKNEYAVVGHINKDSFIDYSGRIIVNLINIEEDKVYKNHINSVPAPNAASGTLPLNGVSRMRVNLYLIFAFNPGNTVESYGNALTLLTHVLRYFQANQHQEIDITGPNPANFSLEINYHNISLEDSNNMWSNLGGEQKPYAMYKVQLLEIEELSTDPVPLVPAISNPTLTNLNSPNSNIHII